MSSTRREVLLAGLGLLVGACRVSDIPIPTYTPEFPPPSPTSVRGTEPTPTIRAESKEALEGPRKIWERKVGKSELGNVNWYDPSPPSFLWTGKKLFSRGPEGQIQQVRLDGKNGDFEWREDGYLLGADRGVIYLTDSQGSRLAILSEENFFELPDVTSVRGSLRSSKRDDKTSVADFKWPMFKTPWLAAFQLENGYYAILYGNKLQTVQGEGQIMQATGDKLFLATSRSPRGSAEWGLYDTTWQIYKWRNRWERPVHALSDQELLVVSYPTKASMHGFLAEARSMDNGAFLWSQETSFARPLFLSTEFVVLGERGANFSHFWILDKKDRKVVEKLTGPGQEDTLYFFESGRTLFASSRSEGTIAWQDGQKKWKNPKVDGAILAAGRIANNFVLIREGQGGQAKKIDGKVWIVDVQTGNELFNGVELSGPISSALLVENKLVVATGVKGERCSLVVVNTETGKPTEVGGLNLTEPLLHLTAVGTNGVLGQSEDRLLAVRVA